VGHDCGPQALYVERPIVTHTVDIERRSALDTAPLATVPVTVDPTTYLRRGPLALESVRFQSQIDRVLMEIVILDRVLVLKQMLVHHPELALCAGRFGGCRGSASVRVNFLEREMPEDKAQIIWVLALQRVDAVARHSRVWAFVVAVLEQRNLGVSRTLDVVIGCNGRGQVERHFWSISFSSPGSGDFETRSDAGA
jgi:hypothetical protein